MTTTEGFHWNPPSWAPDGWTNNDWVFTTVFVIAIVLFVLTSNLIRSGVGRGLVAMRDNETGAAVSGVYPAQYKVLAFATSALVTAIGGSCFALASTTIGPDTFGLQRSIEFIAGLVIGGVATIMGPAIGGLFVEWLPYWAFEVDWPILGKLEGPQAGILYGVILVAHHLLHARRHRVRAPPASFEGRGVRSPSSNSRADFRTAPNPREPANRINTDSLIMRSSVQHTTRERYQ